MINNKKGVTLIELIIVLSILAVVITLGYSIFIFGIKNFTIQTANANNQSNVRYATSFISKEIRKADSVSISSNEITIDGTVTYKLHSNVIMRNTNELVSDIASFNVERVGNRIILEITSVPNASGRNVSLSSKIYIRE